jgi:hypothetical protein
LTMIRHASTHRSAFIGPLSFSGQGRGWERFTSWRHRSVTSKT